MGGRGGGRSLTDQSPVAGQSADRPQTSCDETLSTEKIKINKHVFANVKTALWRLDSSTPCRRCGRRTGLEEAGPTPACVCMFRCRCQSPAACSEAVCTDGNHYYQVQLGTSDHNTPHNNYCYSLQLGPHLPDAPQPSPRAAGVNDAV